MVKRRYTLNKNSEGYENKGIRRAEEIICEHGPVRIVYSRTGATQVDPISAKGRLAAKFRKYPPASERTLRDALKAFERIGIYFQHQVVLHGFIGDFYCPQRMLLVELDGPCHAGRRAYDQKRDRILRKHGIRTVRYSVERLADLDGLLTDIAREVGLELPIGNRGVRD